MSNVSPDELSPGLTVAAVARRIGVAPDTLRTWDRRYGMGPSQHTAGKHRRYSTHDIARLEIMCRLVKDGVMPAEAARVARATDVADLKINRTEIHLVTESEHSDFGVVDFDSPKNAIRGLTRASAMLDSVACQNLISRLIEDKGVLWTWDKVLVPVLITIGEKWESTGEGIEIEHLLSEVILNELRQIAVEVDQPVNARPVILASTPHELHTLPIYAIAAALAEHQIESRILGARTPTEALAAACKKLNPSAVVVWSQSQGTADNLVWAALEPQRPAPVKIAIGPGWGHDFPSDVENTKTLADTLIWVVKAAGH